MLSGTGDHGENVHHESTDLLSETGDHGENVHHESTDLLSGTGDHGENVHHESTDITAKTALLSRCWRGLNLMMKTCIVRPQTSLPAKWDWK